MTLRERYAESRAEGGEVRAVDDPVSVEVEIGPDGIQAMLWPFDRRGEPVLLIDMEPETLAKCQEALLAAALCAMGRTLDEYAALDGFSFAMNGGEDYPPSALWPLPLSRTPRSGRPRRRA